MWMPFFGRSWFGVSVKWYRDSLLAGRKSDFPNKSGTGSVPCIDRCHSESLPVALQAPDYLSASDQDSLWLACVH